MRNETLERLVEADDPVEPAWEALWNVWSPAGESVSAHYDRTREQESLDLE